jgi:DNA-binding Lrp family transcriptional regulator
VDEAALLEKARELEVAGIMRRFSAVLRHRRVGYTANGMACWVVPQSSVEGVGKLAAELPQVSHCYQRPAYPPRWPYSLFTMIHGRTKEQVEDVVQWIAQEAGLVQYEVLYSTREFKKERVRYFEEKT